MNNEENRNEGQDNKTEDFKPMERIVRAELATLRDNQKSGWKRMVTVTKWGTGKFKLDIRDWNADMSRSSKGMTFTRSETEKLRNILSILDLQIIDDYFQGPEANYDNGEEGLKKAV
jgi:hypothetical protein